MYARVEIDKQECGSLCEFNPLGGEDNVETSRINMAHIDDDLAEDDDTSDTAFIGISVVDRVAKDADWFEVTYMQAVEFQALLKSNLAGGMLDMTLFDTMGVTLAQATVNETTGNLHFVDLQPLLAGTYYLQILPTVEDDFNFYDLTLMGSTLQTDCAPGEVQERACGLCGVERKTCSNDGEWEAWLPCAEQGVCEPGSVEIRNCGENGNQEKVCDNECQWGSFGNCIQCTDGESGVCYSGPADTRGVGVCVEGRRTCTGNTWSSCQGDGRPVLENCTDGEDNDCDGAVDRDDSDCIANLGDACLQSNECAADLVCLSAPFPDGYCGQEGCNNCNNGVCSRALGADWCLKPCNNLFDCRAGYLCVNVGLQGESVCAPPCMSDSDCGVNEACQEQICVGGDNPMAGMTMDNGEDEADTGGGAVSSPKDEGCQQTHHTSSTSLLIVLLLVSHLYIRRRDLDYESAKDLA